MQRFADQLIGYVRTVEIGRVDVVYAKLDRFAQHGARRVRILWWTKHVGAGQLHGAVAKTAHGAVAECMGACLIDGGHGVFLGVGKWGHDTTLTSV